MSSHSFFAEELVKVLGDDAARVSRIVEELKDEGFPVSEKNLNDWMNGFFLPRQIESFHLVEALEKILGVKAGLLRQSLIRDLSQGASFVPGEFAPIVEARVPTEIGGKHENKFAASDEQTDWEAELVREVIEDETIIAADRMSATHKVTIFAYGPPAPNPSFSVSTLYGRDELPDKERLVYDVTGAVIADQTIYDDGGDLINVATRLELPDGVVPGDLHVISYTCDYVFTQPGTVAGDRYFVWPLSYYVCRVIFEGEPPAHVEYVTSTYNNGVRGEEHITPLEMDGNVAQISMQDVSGFIGTMRWS